MYIAYDNRVLQPEPTIEKYEVDKVTIPHMVTDKGIEPDDHNRKFVPIGTLVDKDGNPCKISGGAIEGTPVGITVNTKEVTYGPENVAVFIRGHIQGELLNLWGEEYSDDIGKAVMEALPEIHIYPVPAAE